ncbi:MAG: hypothetical protein NTZ65_00140 [Candidatus Berkelbacteria bacterium]|nr:hypothetical protein [Candidatus Berkelbacteria bacterium]
MAESVEAQEVSESEGQTVVCGICQRENEEDRKVCLLCLAPVEKPEEEG